MKNLSLFTFYFLLFSFLTGCTECPIETEPDKQMVLIQTLHLDFADSFQTESVNLVEGYYYEVKFSGEFYYDIYYPLTQRTVHYTSHSGIYTKQRINFWESDWQYTFRISSPLIIVSRFVHEDNLVPGFNPDGIYFFKGTCTKTEPVFFNFKTSWGIIELLNTSGLITVEIFMPASLSEARRGE